MNTPTPDPADVPVVTSEAFGARPIRPIALVTAAACFSRGAFTDAASHMKNWTVGGELTGYSRLLEEATETVTQRVAQRAAELGAHAVVAFRLATTEVSAGAAELIAYGTAVVFEDADSVGSHFSKR